jgi:hypothetical protein
MLTRRGLIAGLLALPFVAPIARAARQLPVPFRQRNNEVLYVGADQEFKTLKSALDAAGPKSVIFVVPGHSETIWAPAKRPRPTFDWRDPA